MIEEPLKAVPEHALDNVEKMTSGRENPHDTKGNGYPDDEEGKAGEIPGEQDGVELDIHAENRPRNSEGEFLGEDDLIF